MHVLLYLHIGETEMKKEHFISVYLDTRRALKSKKYPVKIRVFTPSPRKQKLYPTKFEFSEKEFKGVWEKVKSDDRETQKKIQSVLDKYEKVAESINPFSFDEFEKRLFIKQGDVENVFWHFQQIIDRLILNNQIGYAGTYTQALKSIQDFLKDLTGKDVLKLSFKEITPNWLTRYEDYMLRIGRSQTTIGFYLRNLRAIFNGAIERKEIHQDLYPFGKRLYQIPASKAVKKALSKAELKAFYEAEPRSIEQKTAKDFWFFLYNAAGMNVHDLLKLRYGNINNDKIIYIREKTKRTSKADLRPVVIFMTDYMKSIIEEYGNPENEAGNLIFSIVDESLNEQQQYRQITNFTRFLNQHLQKLASLYGLPEDISTYWSRHTFATHAIRGGASLEQIRQALNHHNLSTTEGYFAGFEDDTMKQISNNLMNF